jgi:hypothetical protein
MGIYFTQVTTISCGLKNRAEIRKKLGRNEGQVESAGINRQKVGDARALQERSSEPPDLESCAGGGDIAGEVLDRGTDGLGIEP